MYMCIKKWNLQPYMKRLWPKRGYFGQLGGNRILVYYWAPAHNISHLHYWIYAPVHNFICDSQFLLLPCHIFGPSGLFVSRNFQRVGPACSSLVFFMNVHGSPALAQLPFWLLQMLKIQTDPSKKYFFPFQKFSLKLSDKWLGYESHSVLHIRVIMSFPEISGYT